MNKHLKILVLSSALFGCSTHTSGGSALAGTPVLYPNAYYRQVGEAQAQQDVRYCMRAGEDYKQEPDRYKQMAKRTVGGAALGAGAGALGGTIMRGQIGRATAAGAAIGGAAGLLSDLFRRGDTDPSAEKVVEHCLNRLGYEVETWR